ncbi:RNA polymerase sigma factor [Methylomonas koyamae]|uniref:RNA polymerase sigma factor n=1 Tax=Methylomonas koyamae TaxID=702114 RepID=UPI0028731313|nr:RNA polymerase sigma factor [Methylomonas koyamae]WNB74783.1 RNA polymerase sigma factor [Methylomonas koyamae]
MNTNHPPLTAAFLRHQAELRQYLLRQVNCPDTAADLLQDTFIRIARLETGDGISNPRAFLYRVAGNLALDHARMAARRGQWDGGDIDEDWACPRPQPDAILAGRQAWRSFLNGLAQLPLPQRQLLLACRIDGKTCREAAAEERITAKQVDRIVRKQLGFLRAQGENVGGNR